MTEEEASREAESGAELSGEERKDERRGSSEEKTGAGLVGEEVNGRERMRDDGNQSGGAGRRRAEWESRRRMERRGICRRRNYWRGDDWSGVARSGEARRGGVESKQKERTCGESAV